MVAYLLNGLIARETRQCAVGFPARSSLYCNFGFSLSLSLDFTGSRFLPRPTAVPVTALLYASCTPSMALSGRSCLLEPLNLASSSFFSPVSLPVAQLASHCIFFDSSSIIFSFFLSRSLLPSSGFGACSIIWRH